MIHQLRSAVAILSLVLCLGTLGLWVRTRNGYRVEQMLVGHLGGRSKTLAAIHSERGAFTLVWITRTPPAPAPLPRTASGDVPLLCMGRDLDDVILSISVDHTLGALSSVGFEFMQVPASWGQDLDPYVRSIEVIGWPHWFVMLLTAIPPTVWMYGRVRGRRTLSVECRKCDYNLTGNTSGVCPECGAAVPPQAEISV